MKAITIEEKDATKTMYNSLKDYINSIPIDFNHKKFAYEGRQLGKTMMSDIYNEYNQNDVQVLDYFDKINVQEHVRRIFAEEIVKENNIRIEFHKEDKSYRVYVGSKLKIKRRQGQHLTILLNYIKPKLSNIAFMKVQERLINDI